MSNPLFFIFVIISALWFLDKFVSYFRNKKKYAQTLEQKKGWQMLNEIRTNISGRSYTEVISVYVNYSNWNSILEKVLGIKSDEILPTFESLGLKSEGDKLFNEFWHGWNAFSFQNYVDVKSGLTISTVTFHGRDKSETYTSSKPIQSFIFSEEIYDFACSVNHGGRSDLDTFAKIQGLTVSEIKERTEKLSKSGLDIEKLRTILSFENDGSIRLKKSNPVDPIKWGPDTIETIVKLPITELRILGRLRSSSGNVKVSEGNLSYYFDILNDWRGREKDIRAVSPYSSVHPLDLLKKKLSDLGLTLNPQEDEWGVYGKGDSFHSKFATVTYENEVFLEQEEIAFLDEEPTRQIAILISDYSKEKFKQPQHESSQS